MTAGKPLGWPGIVRLGLVQSSLGAVVMLATSLLNRIMVVEEALPAMIPAGFVAWHYAVQLSRPRWGHGSDIGRRRTPWIIGGMGVLALGGVLATDATLMVRGHPVLGVGLAILAYSMIGAGVGAAGTSLLALIATRTATERRPAAASITWIMMVAGIVVTAGVAGALLDPFSPRRLAMVAGGIALTAFLVATLAVAGMEGRPERRAAPQAPAAPFGEALREILADAVTRRFTLFVFVSMLAYSTQDMILEPFAGLVFGFTPGQSTELSSVQHMGVLLGMILVGIGGNAFGGLGGLGGDRMRGWIVGGCAGSALAMALLAVGAVAGPAWPLKANVFLLGFANGVFAVAAIGAMMDLAGAGGPGREGIRMGIWGASQAIAFGAGSFIGAAGVDIGRAAFGADGPAFLTVFVVEGAMFLIAATLAARAPRRAIITSEVPA